MSELYPSGSTLVLFFSGVSGSAFLSNDDDSIPVNFRENKGFVRLPKEISKSDLINDYMFLKYDEHYITKYRMVC